MKKQNFLSKLKREGKLELVEPSEEMKNSYLEKSLNSFKASDVLLKTGLLEESVSMSYYAMYHCLLALMFKCGIKCENHTGNILLLKVLFGEEELSDIIIKAKEERIDKQYYVDFNITKEEVQNTIRTTELFDCGMIDFISKMNHQDIEMYRERFKKLVE